MAATATRSKPSSKSASASKKSSSSSSSSDKGGIKLDIRFAKKLRPNKVSSLVVEVPKKGKKKDSDDQGSAGMVVVRPVIPGALVTPTEQRLDVEPGNQITFHVTALAKGRLPKAHLDIFVPGQAPETVLLPMKAKTQRLAMFLFLMTFLVPMFLISLVKGDLRPNKGYPDQDFFSSKMEKDFPPVPIFNRKADFMPKELPGLDLNLQEFTFSESVGKLLYLGYVNFRDEVHTRSWLPNVIGLGFLVLAFLAYQFNRPRRKTLRKTLKLKPQTASDESREAATLEPI